MEKIKQQVSDLAHNLVTIVMITLFMFPVQPAQALVVKPLVKTEAQLKQEVLDKFSNQVYKPSEMLTDEELVLLLKTVGFEGAGGGFSSNADEILVAYNHFIATCIKPMQKSMLLLDKDKINHR